MEPWGLSEHERESIRPWGLAPELLAPRKVTTDELHGDIHTTVLEQALIDTTPFQRLRRVRQLGSAHLIYPGATHTRFAHSLGALKVVHDLLRSVLGQREGLHSVPDLLDQWNDVSADYAAKHGAEAVVLGRLGALLHDLCHVPFGHSVEDDLAVLESHDKNGLRFDGLWGTVLEELPSRVQRHLPNTVNGRARVRALKSLSRLEPGADLYEQLRPMIVSKDERAKKLREEGLAYPFVDDLVGNTICADLLDYLMRDHRNTGLPASLGTRFTSAFFVVPDGRGPFSRRAALALMRDGHERTDVVSELLKALRYRYELSERVLYHHGKLVADAMLGRALDCWSKAVWLEEAADRIAHLDQAETLIERADLHELQKQIAHVLADERKRSRKPHDCEAAASDPIRDNVRERLETEFLEHGDDSLVDRVCQLQEDAPAAELVEPLVSDFRGYAAKLMSDYRDRRLFRIAGRVGVRDAPATELYQRYGDAERRIALEEAAQRFAELGREPSVIMWLPDPKMRIKLARVLVDDGDHIDRFNAYEDARGRRGDDIYRADRNLWGLWVYTRRDVGREDEDAVLAYLAHRLGVAWESRRKAFGSEPSTWLPRYGLHRLLGLGLRHPTVEKLVPEVVQVSARGSGEDPREFATVRDLCGALEEVELVKEELLKIRRSGSGGGRAGH